MFGDFAGSFARQAAIVAVDGLQSRRQRAIVGMTDQVQADVQPIAHARENRAQGFDRLVGNVGDAGFEVYRLDEAAQLDGLEAVNGGLARFEPVAQFLVDAVGILDPLPGWHVV